jgi:tetratricopeptide (TPR) repeat protein
MTRNKMMRFKRSSGFVCLMVGLLISSLGATQALAQSGNAACGSLTNAYGPYDYRTDRDKLPIVLVNHFTPEVEALVRGKTGTRPGRDIDYTLRAIPNNHRALLAMMRLGEKEKTPQPSGSRYTIECWFERAVLFRPDDGIVRMIYSSYLNSKGRIPEANKQLEIATTYAKDSAFTHYNIGLHYFNLKNYDKALVQAHKAIELGFPQTILRDQLQSVGKWTEPEELPITTIINNAPAEQTK